MLRIPWGMWGALHRLKSTPIFRAMNFQSAGNATWASIRLMMMVLVAATVFSCDALKFKGGRGSGPPPVDADGRWDPGPRSIRVYPSTRLAVHDGQWYLEALIECRDEMKDSTKCVGNFQFELFHSPVDPGDATGQRLYVWNVRLRTLDDQRSHYDPTLRTYKFRLKMQPLSGDVDQVVFRVMYDNETGRRMEAQARLSARIESTHP